MTERDPFENFKPGADAYRTMTKEEIQEDMDARYSTGRAYPDSRLWVFTYHDHVEKRMAALVKGHTKNKVILELGCGGAGVAAFHVTNAKHIIATDLSEVALQQGREFFVGRSELEFRWLDAEVMSLPNESVDIVIAKEVMEHLPNPGKCISEIHRVLKPGGLFLFSTPNGDSLHLRLNRKLGHPDFMCSGDHIKEYGYTEMVRMLAAGGLSIAHSEGVLLMPYHYVEGVFPPAVDALESSDEEFVNMLKELGRRVGPEYSFGYIIISEKRREPRFAPDGSLIKKPEKDKTVRKRPRP